MKTPTKADEYVKRLLAEKPTSTRSGIPIKIESNGRRVLTFSGRSKNGEYSVYNPTDYPQLFGWTKEEVKMDRVNYVAPVPNSDFAFIKKDGVEVKPMDKTTHSGFTFRLDTVAGDQIRFGLNKSHAREMITEMIKIMALQEPNILLADRSDENES